MWEYIKVMAIQMVLACIVGYLLVYLMIEGFSWIVGLFQ